MSVLALPVSHRDNIQGLPIAVITLVKYDDYQCPDSAKTHGIVQEIQQQIGNSLCYVFRHFPCSNIHPQAWKTAEAAEAVAKQGQFWRMRDRLFTHQHALRDGDLAEHAARLELDVMQFLREMSKNVHVPRVQADIDSGIQSGVTRTPTFFINRLRYDGACDKETLIAALIRDQSPGSNS